MSNATIRVSFGNGSSSAPGAHLSAEIDTREAGLNGGRTSFSPGDDVWFLVYMSDNVQVDGNPLPSAGSITAGTPFSVTNSQEVEFADTNTSSLSVPATSIVSTLWFGNDLGIPVLQSDKTTIKVPTKGVGSCVVEASSMAHPYKLSSPTSVPGASGDSVYDFSIVVVVKGKVVVP